MGTVIRSGDLELDLGLQRAFRAGRRLWLTRKEFLFLCKLVQAQGRMVSRKNLLVCVWEREFSESNILESLVCRLRKKVNRCSRVKLIRNVRRIGYRLNSSAGTFPDRQSDFAGASSNPSAVTGIEGGET